MSLVLSHKFNLQILRGKIMTIIQTYPKEWFESYTFLQLPKEADKSVFNCDILGMEEIDGFRTGLAWAEEECERHNLRFNDENRRNTLGTILYSIRFPIMDGQTFCDNICERNILTSDEKCDIMKQLLSKKKPYLSSFNSKHRSFPVIREISRFPMSVQGRWNGSDNSISISLKGILMYERHDSHPYRLAVTKCTEIISSQNKDGISSTKVVTNNRFKLYLPNPIHL